MSIKYALNKHDSAKNRDKIRGNFYNEKPEIAANCYD